MPVMRCGAWIILSCCLSTIAQLCSGAFIQHQLAGALSYHPSPYMPRLQATFMREFSCCGMNVATLHNLLQHYDECHVQETSFSMLQHQSQLNTGPPDPRAAIAASTATAVQQQAPSRQQQIQQRQEPAILPLQTPSINPSLLNQNCSSQTSAGPSQDFTVYRNGRHRPVWYKRQGKSREGRGQWTSRPAQISIPPTLETRDSVHSGRSHTAMASAQRQDMWYYNSQMARSATLLTSSEVVSDEALTWDQWDERIRDYQMEAGQKLGLYTNQFVTGMEPALYGQDSCLLPYLPRHPQRA